jgi:hypothetical protein
MIYLTCKLLIIMNNLLVYNTKDNYQLSLIIAMFYNKQCMITDNNLLCLYLNEYIKDKIINKIKNNIPLYNKIHTDLNKILYNSGYYEDNILDLHNFFFDKFNITHIDLLIDDVVKSVKYISVNIPEHTYVINLSSLIYDKIGILTNTPDIITIYLGVHPNVSINIQKRMAFTGQKRYLVNYIWYFYSVICYSQITLKYYVIFIYHNEYYIFDADNIPCIYKADMTDVHLVERIKRESVLIYYRKN